MHDSSGTPSGPARHEADSDLPAPHRLALAYAPAAARPAWTALLALDLRLAALLREAREPLLAQIRLAWWRDRLNEESASWPIGEPVLAALASWRGRHRLLVDLVNGWEQLLGDAPLPAERLAAMAHGRATAIAALAEVLGEGDQVRERAMHAGRLWALSDLAAHLNHPAEIADVQALLAGEPSSMPLLPRSLRPLPVMHALVTRHGGRAILVAMRLGLFGR